MPTTEVATTLLPATDALSLACAAVASAKADHAVIGGDQAVTVNWNGRRARSHHSDLLDCDLDIPAAWMVTARVEVFSIGWVE